MLQLQFIIVPSIAIVLAVVAIVFMRLAYLDDWDSIVATVIGIMATLFGGVLVIVAILIFIPFQTKYWVITHPSGTVAANTFTPGQIQQSGDTYTIYTLRLQGDPNQYVINDARASQFKPGDRINLACTLQWNYGGQDQWNCGLGTQKGHTK